MIGVSDPSQNFCIWQPTRTFSNLFELHIAATDCKTFFGPKGQWLRDAWLAQQFAERTNARAVKISGKEIERPDFQVAYKNGHILNVEATEALEPERRRGDEIWRLYSSGHRERVSAIGDWSRFRKLILPALSHAVVQKCQKSEKLRLQKKDYPSRTHLFVYLNVSTFGSWEQEIASEFRHVAAHARGYFPVVWVLWCGKIWRLPTVASTAGTDLKSSAIRELGWAMSSYRDKRFLDDIFSRDDCGCRYDR